jgi:hypothetical protein
VATTQRIDTNALARDLRPAGIAGWAATVMLIGGAILTSSVGPIPEPAFDAPAAEIQRYLQSQSATAGAVGGFVIAFGLCALLWFVCGLSAALRRSGARPEWLPTVVLVSGTAAVAALLTGAPQATAFRGGDGLAAQLAQFAFDLSNITFANMWVAFGSLSLASGWAILSGRTAPNTPGQPRWPAWLGWWALAVGVGFLLARTVWTTWVWAIPYAPFWVWVLVVSTRMLRTRR